MRESVDLRPAVPPAPTSLVGRPLGEILRAVAGLSETALEEALRAQADEGGRLGEVLVARKAVSADDVAKALALQLDLPYLGQVSLDAVDAELVQQVPINFAKQALILPLRLDGESVELLVADPLDTTVLDHARMLLQRNVSPRVATSAVIVDAINGVYDRAVNEAEQLVGEMEAQDLQSLAHELEEPQDLLDVDDEAPIIRLVNSLLFRAAKERASDIHIEPMERELLVRFRIDGVLQEIIKPPKRNQNSIVSRVKVMGQLNIAEKRLPQDGRIRIKLAGRDIDIRLSTIPCTFGERIVMRLLDKNTTLLDLQDIGMGVDTMRGMDQVIKRSHGIILVTGPTGSGKTTTLYAALSRINTPDLNILTVEDPVEYQLKGVNQIAVRPKIGLTFAGGLRHIVRQDPDVIMVGEIRDLETAEIAVHAALTGHLVFSTLHTNDAPGAITRLQDMGVEPYLLASVLSGVLAQRLVRRICQSCRVPHVPDPADLLAIGVSDSHGVELYRGEGCDACRKTGYKGRSGIYELFVISEEIRSLILRKAATNEIRRTAMDHGMVTLREDGWAKAQAGITTVEEILRVTQED